MTRPLDDLFASGATASPLPAPATAPFSFSVIVRTQGTRPLALVEALDSLAAQDTDPRTVAAVEVIVVVHGETDRTAAVRDALGDRAARDGVRLVAAVGGGRSRPLNHGLDAATGDYVCFLDDDDLALPDWIGAFARSAEANPGMVVRAVTQSQRWTTEGGTDPVRSTGPIEYPFPDRFDFLAHLSVNQTPICSIAVPRSVLDAFAIRFSEDLPVFEDWDLLMRVASLTGVVSIPDATSRYRRLDRGNADDASNEGEWLDAHAAVIERLSARPLLLPAGSAARLASAHFVADGGSRWEADHLASVAELDRITRSPRRWLAAFARRASSAIRSRMRRRTP